MGRCLDELFMDLYYQKVKDQEGKSLPSCCGSREMQWPARTTPSLAPREVPSCNRNVTCKRVDATRCGPGVAGISRGRQVKIFTGLLSRIVPKPPRSVN